MTSSTVTCGNARVFSKPDRNLITVAAIVATYRPEQLTSHLTRALNNGPPEEITEVIKQMVLAR
jgi:4-carboxymuconolactone decarboxylase